jgi:hypothetical protein
LYGDSLIPIVTPSVYPLRQKKSLDRLLHGNIRKSGDLKIAGRRGFYRLTSTGYGYLSKFRRGNANGSVTFFQIDEKNPDFYRRLW